MSAPTQRNDSTVRHYRNPDHPVDPIFVDRWSPRAFDAKVMQKGDLYTILEAARWAPSAFNIQPWRFIYAMRGDAHWAAFLDLLDPFNAGWAENASALVFVVSNTMTPAHGSSPTKPSQTHSFDTGAAWAHLALQATALGYQAHAMAGIHFDAVRQQLWVPDHYRVEIAVAIGYQADPSCLPPTLREREKPSSRLALAEIAFVGRFAPGPSKSMSDAADSTTGNQQ